jgi:CRP/FNR family transcriptional regulator, cyclic AMP receptor protein
VIPVELKFAAHLPVFRGLSPAELAKLSEGSRLVRLGAGEVLCREGQAGDGFFVIEQGAVRVTRTTAAGDVVTLTRLVAPTVVGEMALLDAAPRSADVSAEGAVTAYWLSAAHFEALRSANSPTAYKVVRNLAGTLCERLRDVNERLDGFFKDPERALRELQHWQKEQWRERMEAK